MISPNDALRDEIAAVAARLIAEDGLDYAGAKARAVREVVGPTQRRVDCMPDNARVEAAVRDHQALFMRDTQPARLARLREVARDVMRFLVDAGLGLEPMACGALVNGTAGEHSDVHLMLFADNAKDIEIHLLNAAVDFEVDAIDGARHGEMLSFLWLPRGMRGVGSGGASREAIHLAVHDPRERHRTSRVERVDLGGLERLIAAAAA